MDSPGPHLSPLSKAHPIAATAPLRILDFDIETRKIGFHYGGKYSPDGCEPVAIAWSWTDEEKVTVTLQPEDDLAYMLEKFRSVYDQASIVTGHYIRKFDLKVLQGNLLEQRLPPLSPKKVSDTHGDLKKRGGISVSQENLAVMRGLEESKFHMADQNWREVARLTPAAMERARERVVRDVIQHKAVRDDLAADGWLKPATMWSP